MHAQSKGSPKAPRYFSKMMGEHSMNIVQGKKRVPPGARGSSITAREPSDRSCFQATSRGLLPMFRAMLDLGNG
jgi:hypothetical protein